MSIDRLARGQWQLGIAYRHLSANQWLVGTQVREDRAPFGHLLFLNINSFDFAVDYGASDHTRLTVVLPFSDGTHSRFYADGVRHKVSASGLGDISVMATRWMNNSVELGMGIKTASGRNDARGDYFLPSGTTTFYVDQSIQLGDGGWGVILQGDAFRQLFRNGYGYASASYLISPRNQTNVIQGQAGPYSKIRVSVPDVYNARAGLSYNFSRFALTLGGRLDGIPLRDVIGKSDGFRRPVVIVYVEPGIGVTRGSDTFGITIPVRAYADFRPSLVDRQLGNSGGGDLARTLFFASYRHRF